MSHIIYGTRYESDLWVWLSWQQLIQLTKVNSEREGPEQNLQISLVKHNVWKWKQMHRGKMRLKTFKSVKNIFKICWCWHKERCAYKHPGRRSPQLKFWVQFISFQKNFPFETSSRLMVNWKRLRLSIKYYWEFFQKYKTDFGLMVK